MPQRAQSKGMLPSAGQAATYVFLGVWLIAVILPLAWVFVSSFRSAQEFINNPFGLPWFIAGAPPSIEATSLWHAAAENYRRAWVDSHFAKYFINSLIVTGVSLVGILAVGSMAAYVLARYTFRGQHALFLFFISGMMIPAQLLLLPLFFQMNSLSELGTELLAPFGYTLQLHDSLFGLIIVYIALSLPFTILVLTGFFKSLPSELREAAIIDGCGEYRAFWHVMLPLARPGIITAAIFNFLGLWNEYLFALVLITSPEKNTLPLGLASISMQAQYKTDFGLLFAGLVIVIVPTLIVYLMLQRQITRGITVGALKG